MAGLTQKSSEVAVIHVACLLTGITAKKVRAFERFLRKS
jgi:hypothetical protein